MAGTALDMTAEELRPYRPDRGPEEWVETERWKRAWEVAHGAARLLREAFGAGRVVAFGSLAHRAWFSPSSDIDLAAWGIPADQFYRAVAVAGISPDLQVDLVEPNGCRRALRESIEHERLDLRVNGFSDRRSVSVANWQRQPASAGSSVEEKRRP